MIKMLGESEEWSDGKVIIPADRRVNQHKKSCSYCTQLLFPSKHWVAVANNLLRSCHINQHIKCLCECGAEVFVHLYESILREKVPDYIATPRSQEDDAHNVQAIIDSLALDYLQMSLSHITGENIVRGEKKSIRNLLEIFDGLLDYLRGETDESSLQNGANLLSNNETQLASDVQLESNAGELPHPLGFSSAEGCQSEFSVPSSGAGRPEYTSELIRLGDTAHSFSKRAEDSPHLRYPRRPRFLSPSSSQHQLFSELEDKPCSNGTGQTRKLCSQLQKDRDERTKQAKMVAKAYEDELRICEARQRLRISKLREVIRKMKQEYKENTFEEPPKTPQPVEVYSRRATPQNPEYSQWNPTPGTGKPKEAAPMTVGDDDLLSQLLEEFPDLHVSQPAMKKMRQQQLAHTKQLKAAFDRPRAKLQNEVEQALKKHDLFLALIKKYEDHNKRLQEHKQQIWQQKWAQNKWRERRQQVARARKCYQDYQVQLRAERMWARTWEERIFKNLFEDGLEIQKEVLKDLRAYAQEKHAEQRRQLEKMLESLENYHKDKFSRLAVASCKNSEKFKPEKVKGQKTERDQG